MTSNSSKLNDRILQVCKLFMEEDGNRYKEKRDDNFYSKFKTFLKKSHGYDSLYQRGCSENLRSQWQQNKSERECQLHPLLEGDDIERISFSKLIEQLRDSGSSKGYDFEISAEDMVDVLNELEEYVLTESVTQLKKVLDQPRFYCNHQAYCLAFAKESSQEKGLLTRIQDKDPTLIELTATQRKAENIKDDQGVVKRLQRIFDLQGGPTGERLVSDLSTLALETSQKNSFDFGELQLRRLQLCERVHSTLKEKTSSMRPELQVQGYLALSMVSQQLKHALTACKLLLDCHQKRHQGKRVAIEQLMKKIRELKWPQIAKIEAKDPSFAESVSKKAEENRKFFGQLNLIALVTGQDYADPEQDSWQPDDSQPTALENLFSFVRMMRFIGEGAKTKSYSIMDLFQNHLVIDQSVATYTTLLDLLQTLMPMCSTEEGGNSEEAQKQKKILFYCLDGFLDILNNNLHALFESEKTSLKIVFATGCKSKFPLPADYLQKTYYPELLKILLWRLKQGNQNEYNAVADTSHWVKVLPFDDMKALKQIYEDSQIDNASTTLFQEHLKLIPHLLDFTEGLPAILESLKATETDSEYSSKLERAQTFLRMAVQQQSPAAGTLIREVFASKISNVADVKKDEATICDNLSQMIKAMLFMASDNRQSKIAIVLKDVLSQGTEFKQSEFNLKLMRMMVADSVNILNNVQEVELTTSKQDEKDKFSWKTVVQTHNLYGNDIGDKHYTDFTSIKDSTIDSKLPEISEVGLWIDKFVNGVTIIYRDGTSFTRRGNANQGQYTSLKLGRGEHISIAHGRFGAWGDQMKFTTNLGRTLQGGGEGGTPKDPAYPPGSYVIGLDTHYHNHLTRVEVHYVNLDEIPWLKKDPLVSLIFESDLLSKGIEQRHMSVFSESTLNEIKKVQELIGKPILDDSVTPQASSASSLQTTMINTGGTSQIPSSATDGDIHTQIIHSGQNQPLDDLIQVLQLLLGESREPIRNQMNIMRDNGLAATRACFAVIIKLSGLTGRLESVLQCLEVEALDIEEDLSPQARLKKLKEAAKDLTSETPLLLNEWCNATKMRKWLKDQVLPSASSTSQEMTIEEENVKIQELLGGIVAKAEFLSKLQKSNFFQSLDPKQEIFELSYKIPSHERDYVKDQSQIKADIEESTLWRQSYKEWKTNLKEQGTIRSHQQKVQEIRQIGTSAIIVCLQQTDITRETLQGIVEKNFLNSCYRLAGLQLLEYVMELVTKLAATNEKPSKELILTIRNVTAALNQGIRKDNQNRCHYLDGIKSCGDHLESLIRSTFFAIVGGISDNFVHAEYSYLMELLSCLDWSFKARDFENLHDLKVFKLLHTGVSLKVTEKNGEVLNQNVVLQKWKNQPFNKITLDLKVLSSDLYLAIVSRLAEPEARKIIFNKDEEKATGVGSLSRAQSAVNINSAQALLSEAFNMMFREFHEFTLVSGKIDGYISLEQLNLFRANGESDSQAEKMMPELHNGTMEKIIANLPFESAEAEEETKANEMTSPEQVNLLVKAEEKKAPAKKWHDPSLYTPEQIEVLQLIDSGVQLSQPQQQVINQLDEIKEDDDLGGMFNEEEYEEEAPVQEEEKLQPLTKNDPQVPQVRQKLVQCYRAYHEKSNIRRYLKMVLIFVKIATKAPYPLEMLQNVANPYHIKLLLQLLFQVSVECKLQILTIFQTLLRIQVPLSVFNESIKELNFGFRTDSKIEFKSSFAKFFFQAALQIQAQTWNSVFTEDKRSGMHDVSVQLTRTMALCLKIQDSQSTHCEDLSAAFMKLEEGELSEAESHCLFQVVQATCTMPVVGDSILLAESEQSNGEPETASQLTWSDRMKVFESPRHTIGCQIVPELVPDSLIPLKLSDSAIKSLISYLSKHLLKTMKSEKFQPTLEICHVIKLFLHLANDPETSKTFDKISKLDRLLLIKSLSAIAAFQSEKEKEADENLYTTSLVEFAVAVHLRDQVEQIDSSGSEENLFQESPQINKKGDQNVKSLELRSRRSTVQKKTNSAANKYSKQLLAKAKGMKKAGAVGKQSEKAQKNQNLARQLLGDKFASVEELIEMNAAVVEYCRASGCTLFDVLYGLNETLGEEKTYISSESIIEMFNDQLEALAENEDSAKDYDLEKQLVEQVTKKIEKIIQLQKPGVLKAEILPKIDLATVVQEVEARTHGMSNLMRTRVQDRIFDKTSVYKAYCEKQSNININIKACFKTDLQKSQTGSGWPISSGQWPITTHDRFFEDVKAAQILASRFAEKLLFSIYNPSIDLLGGPQQGEEGKEEDKRDIADMMAGVQQSPQTTVCYSHVFGAILDGLRSFAKTIEILNVSKGIECCWEARFTQNFKVNSQLTTDFDCLRKLDDFAITKTTLQSKSASEFASKAESMLNYKLLETWQGTPELRLAADTFMVYLLKCVIRTTYDEVSAKVEDKPRYLSTLVDALSLDRPRYCGTHELVERIKLINQAIIRSGKVNLIGTYGPDLLNLILFAVLLKSNLIPQQRLLIDNAFQLIDVFDSANLKEFVEMGAWEKVAQSKVIKKVLEETKIHSGEGNLMKTQNKSLFSILLLELQARICNIDAKVAKFVTKKSTSVLDKSLKEEVSEFNLQVLDKLTNTNLEIRMLNDFVQSLEKGEKVKQEFSVVSMGAQDEAVWTTLDLDYIDGAKVQFKIDSDTSEEMANVEFVVKYRAMGDEEKSMTMLTTSKPLEVAIEVKQLKVRCEAREVLSNVCELDKPKNKFKLVNGLVRQVLPSTDYLSLFMVTEHDIYEVKLYPGAGEEKVKVIAVPDNLTIREHHFIKIMTFGDGIVFQTDKGIFSENDNLALTEIGGKKVVNFVVKDLVRCYVTEDGRMHIQGLKDKLAQQMGNVAHEALNILDAPALLKGFERGDKIVDCQIGGDGSKKYCYLTVLRNGNKLLFTKGYNQKQILGRIDTHENDLFFPVIGQTEESSFEKVFLFEEVAFAVEKDGELVVIGGSLVYPDRSIFPISLGYEHFSIPTRTYLLRVVRQKLALGDDVTLKVVDLVYTPEIILVAIESTSVASDGGKPTLMKVSLTVTLQGKYEVAQVRSNNVFVINHKLMVLEESKQEEGQLSTAPKALLRITAKPLVYNIENISSQQIMAMGDHDLKVQLKDIARLVQNQGLQEKVYRAMNNLIRIQAGGSMPSSLKLKEIVQDALQDSNPAVDNALRVWDDTDKKSDIEKLATAILNINIDFNLQEEEDLRTIRSTLLQDPLLTDQLLEMRMNQTDVPPSINLSSRFIEANLLLLARLQDQLFNDAPKVACCSESRIAIVIERFKASQFALDGKVDDGTGDTQFSQVIKGMREQQQDKWETWWRRDGNDDRVFRANFRGESSIDVGGPYREVMENMCSELCSSVLPVLIPTENQRHEHGYMRESFTLNHNAITQADLKLIRYFGLIIGFAIRSCQTQNIALHPTIYKSIVGVPYDLKEDLRTSDQYMFQMFENIREQAKSAKSEAEFQESIVDQCFTVDIGDRQTELMQGGASIQVTRENHEDYIRMASSKLLNKAAVQMEHFLSGVYFVIDKSACEFLSWKNAEIRAMGESIIDIQVLKKYTQDESFGSPTIEWFWEILTEMSEDDKQLYLKFVNGRSKLPTDPSTFRKHKISRGPKNNADGRLPLSHTCFFEIDLPNYSSKEIMRKQLLIAIRFCGEIDTD